MLDANQLTKRAYRPSLKSYFVLTEVGACQSYNLRLTYVDGEVLMVNLQPLIASTKALYPLKNADPFVKAKLEKNAAKQTLDQLHERRKQVVRLHKKGITIMPIAAMTGLIYPKEPPTAKRGIPRCAKPLWWWVGSRLLRTWPGLKKTGSTTFEWAARPARCVCLQQVLGACYLLLHGDDGEAVPGLFSIKDPVAGPQVCSAEDLKKLGYPTEPTQPSYLPYDIESRR